MAPPPPNTTPQHVKAQMSRVVLMLAFHFPPFAQSTGGQRVLSFARHLPRHGWNPIVLTAREKAYPEIDPSSLAQLPPDLEVVRAWGVDVGRRVAIRGRYPSWLAIPDRWAELGSRRVHRRNASDSDAFAGRVMGDISDP